MTAFYWFAFAAFLASFGFSAYRIQGMTKYTLQSGLSRGQSWLRYRNLISKKSRDF